MLAYGHVLPFIGMTAFFEWTILAPLQLQRHIASASSRYSKTMTDFYPASKPFKEEFLDVSELSVSHRSPSAYRLHGGAHLRRENKGILRLYERNRSAYPFACLNYVVRLHILTSINLVFLPSWPGLLGLPCKRVTNLNHGRHSIYIAQHGKPDGKPVVFIHGGSVISIYII